MMQRFRKVIDNNLVQLLLDKTAGFIVLVAIAYRTKANKVNKGDLFQQVWKDITNNQIIFTLLSYIYHPHQLLAQERLMLRMLYKFRKSKLAVNVNVNVKLEKDCPKTILSGNTKGIFFAIHNGIHFSLNEITKFGLPAATIVADIDEIVNSGPVYLNQMVENYELIKRDSRSLVKFKAAAHSGKNLYIAVDYEDEITNIFQYVSPTPFAFAHRVKLPMYFIKEAIHKNGDVDITIKQFVTTELDLASQVDKQSMATASAAAFIRYVQTTYPNFKRELTIKEYQQ